MSVLNKIPYISAVIGSMSAEQLSTLTTLMNGGGVYDNNTSNVFGIAPAFCI